MNTIHIIYLVFCFLYIIFIFLIHLKYYYKCVDLIKKYRNEKCKENFFHFFTINIFYRYKYVVEKIEELKKNHNYTFRDYIRYDFERDIYGYMFSKVQYPAKQYILYCLFLSIIPIMINITIILYLTAIIFK